MKKIRKILSYTNVIKREKATALLSYRDSLHTNYPYLRHRLCEINCHAAIVNSDHNALVRWQERQEYYYRRLIKLRPRNNEFYHLDKVPNPYA